MTDTNRKARTKGGHEDILDSDPHDTIQVQACRYIEDHNRMKRDRKKRNKGSDTC